MTRANESAKGRRQRLARLYERDVSTWTDGELIGLLRDHYAPTEIPACRVCGRGPADDHYSRSRFEDHRCGGDENVVELIRRYELARPTSMSIDVQSIVGLGLPEHEGVVLADQILGIAEWDGLELDARRCQVGLLISTFFCEFLQRIADAAPHRLSAARTLKWTLEYPFQTENVNRWMTTFVPFMEPQQ